MRNVLITGASRGIGAETARLFAAQGDNVIINYFRHRVLPKMGNHPVRNGKQ